MLKAGRLGIMAIFLVMMTVAAPALPTFAAYTGNPYMHSLLTTVRLLMMFALAVAAESLFFDYHVRLFNEIRPKSVYCFRRAGLFWKYSSFFILILSFGISYLGYTIAIAVFLAAFLLMYFPTRGDYIYFTAKEAYYLRDYSVLYTKITGYSCEGGELRLYFNYSRQVILPQIPDNECSVDEAVHELAIRGVRKN